MVDLTDRQKRAPALTALLEAARAHPGAPMLFNEVFCRYPGLSMVGGELYGWISRD